MRKCESGKNSYAIIVLSNGMELTVKTMVMALCNRKGWISFFPIVSNTIRKDFVNGKICSFKLKTEVLIFIKSFVKQGVFLHTYM